MADAITFSSEEERSAYRAMLLIRRFEEKAGQLYALGAIQGSSPLAIGQEAVCVGLAMAAAPDDCFVTAHRSHGVMLALGCRPEEIMAELLGRATGLAGGLGGSHYVVAPREGFWGGYVTPGQTASIAAGLGFASRYGGRGRVAISLIGDGASGRGRVIEAYAHAARMSLPVVFVIDNNAGSADEGLALGHQGCLAEAGRAYNIPGVQVDGIDVRKVRAQAHKAIAHARRGCGPTILEMMTYRYRGHGGMPARAGQAEKRRDDADPVSKARARIIEEGVAKEPELKAIEKDVRDLVNAAAQAAKAAPLPQVSETTS